MNIYSVDKVFMKIISFKYTKADGKTSERSALEIKSPSKFYQMIDMSEISPEEQGEFAAKAAMLYEELNTKMTKLIDEYDLNNRFRQFDPEKMTEVNTDWI